MDACKIGSSLGDVCHKTTHCRKEGFVSVTELSEEDKELLKWRCGINNLSSGDSVCFHHEKLYLSRFESLQTFCADPYKRHKKHITSKSFFYS